KTNSHDMEVFAHEGRFAFEVEYAGKGLRRQIRRGQESGFFRRLTAQRAGFHEFGALAQFANHGDLLLEGQSGKLLSEAEFGGQGLFQRGHGDWRLLLKDFHLSNKLWIARIFSSLDSLKASSSMNCSTRARSLARPRRRAMAMRCSAVMTREGTSKRGASMALSKASFKRGSLAGRNCTNSPAMLRCSPVTPKPKGRR